MNRKTVALSFLIFTVTFMGCVENNARNSFDNSEQEAEILSFMVDTMTVPFPLPPPPPKDGSMPPKINWDSLNNLKMTVIVDTIMFKTSKKFSLPEELKKYQNMADSLAFLDEKTIKKNLIKSEEGHTLIFGNSLKDYEGKYPQLISISRIVWDTEKNTAALYASHSTHPLASYLGFFLLEKKNGKWTIKFKDIFEVS